MDRIILAIVVFLVLLYLFRAFVQKKSKKYKYVKLNQLYLENPGFNDQLSYPRTYKGYGHKRCMHNF